MMSKRGLNDYNGPESEDEEKLQRPLIKKIVIGFFSFVAIAGLLYLSGIYQLLLFRSTSPNVKQEVLDSALDVEKLYIPITVYILKSEGPKGSERDRENVLRMIKKASNIWRQANIELKVKSIVELDVDEEDINVFLRTPGNYIRDFGDYDDRAVNVFLVNVLGGLNGVSFGGLNTVAVADKTTAFDFRVFAHEIGHVLGLAHAEKDKGRLMHQGANGFELTLDEIMRARRSLY